VEIRAQPGSRANALRCTSTGQVKICVTQVPEKGRANKALLDVLAEAIGVRRSQVELLSGQTASRKRILVRGLSAAELTRRLQQCVGENDE
jgi:uncharacterized protein YggU (UPF0235/DUF167 family)